MPTSEMTELSRRQPTEQEPPLRAPTLLKMLGHAALYGYTHLRTTRNRPSPLFEIMEKEVANLPQPLHPDIATTIDNTKAVLAKHDITTPEPSSLSHKFMQSVRLIQFTDRFSSRDQAFFDYSTMKTLKDCFVDAAEQQAYPLGFDQQLDIALELSGGDTINSLTTLWLTSRQYSRWFDNVSIHNLPGFTPEEIMSEMKEWRSTILACKNAGNGDFQDTGGDSYYAWTHALSRVIYGSDSGIPNRIGKYIFSHGTDINTRVHKFKFLKQSIPSNHTIAAAYGNSIGDAILEAIQTK